MPGAQADAHAGFHSFADGTPRPAEAPQPPNPSEPIQPFEDVDWTSAEPVGGPEWPRTAIGAGALAALGVVVAIGWTALQLAPRPEPRAPAVASTPAPAAPPPQLQVELAEAPVASPPPPEPAVTLEAPPRTRLGAQYRETPPLPVRPAQPAALPPRPPVAVMTAEASPDAGSAALDTTAREAPPRTAYDCPDAPTRAGAMLCRDRGLASMDLKMKRAYAAALAAGVPAGELRHDQEVWLGAREEAAGVSGRAVAKAYRERIAELQSMTDGARR